MWTMQLGLRKKTSTEQLKVLVKVSEDEVKQLEDVKEVRPIFHHCFWV